MRYDVLNSFLSLLSFLVFLSACSDSDNPQINSVWLNVSSAPAAEVACSYPGQVLCLRGKNFSGVKALYVNDTEVNIDGSYIYATDYAYTFTVPTNVKVSEDYDLCSIRMVTGDGEATYSPFIIRAKSEKPSITKVSTSTLVAGEKLTITGKNFGSVVEVWLPTVFNGQVKCEIDSSTRQTATSVTVIVPAGATFTSGRVELVIERYEYVSDRDGRIYRETVYSDKLTFS